MSLPVFDAHFHIIDPRFPLIANHGYLPPAFSASDYAQVRPASVLAGAVVSGSFQAFDQSYLVDALEQLGPTYVGVTQLPHTVTDAEILELDRRGVRAVRFICTGAARRGSTNWPIWRSGSISWPVGMWSSMPMRSISPRSCHC